MGQPYGEGFWSDRYRFLDYTGSRFIEVQEKMLNAQLGEAGSIPVAGNILNGAAPGSMSAFLRNVPLTTIDDYASDLSQLHDSAAGRNYTWAFTLYGAGKEKWIPFTQRAIKVLGDNSMGALGLAAGTSKGFGQIYPGARVVYNIPPRPYLAGFAAFELERRFGLQGVLDPTTAENMEFEDRIRAGFRVAMGTGVDIFVSMTSVLKHISERFRAGLSSDSRDRSSESSIGMRAAMRYLSAKGRAKLSGRELKPRDLWKPKAILGWGLDTRHFRDGLNEDWGRPPFELYASTEVGIMGLQYGKDRAIAVNPEACFVEFLPESELEAVRNDPKYAPKTALLPDVNTEERYEVVVTSFHGMPFVRYRTGHMVRFSPGQLGYGPDMEQVGRADDRLDLGGFTRIDESTIWKAISASGIGIADWIVRREASDSKPTLHMYAEPSPGTELAELSQRLHRALVDVDPLYADLVSMLGWQPFKITVLNPGTFRSYYEDMRNAGKDLLARKPKRMNAPDETVDHLLLLGQRQQRTHAA